MSGPENEMVRLLFAVLATIAVVACCMANTHHVELSFVVGAPIRVRLIFLLASMFFLGMVLSWLLRVFARARSRRANVAPPEEQ